MNLVFIFSDFAAHVIVFLRPWGKYVMKQMKRIFLPSFLVSVIYSKAKLASACGGIIYFLSYVPYMYVAIREEVAHDKITAFEKCIAVRHHQSKLFEFVVRSVVL